jgi:peptidoglycan hydrolase-like protein with peptidoglycan-binding domain
VALSRDLASNTVWAASLERSLARRGRPRRASLELGKLTPPRDLSDPDNLAESVLYWRTRRAASTGSPIPAAGGATALALLAATTLPALAGGHSGSAKTIVRSSAGRAGSRAGASSQVVRLAPASRKAFETALGVASRAQTSGTAAAAATAKAKSYGAVTYGSVSRVQRLLGLTADGVLGSHTAAAIRQFQTSHDLTVNGIVDEATFDAMQAAAPASTPAATGAGLIVHAAMVAETAPLATGGTTAPTSTTQTAGATSAPAAASPSAAAGGATAVTASVADTAAAATQPAVPNGVVALQTALRLPADGTFGSQTKAAVEAFQAAHGLTVDGVVGQDTRAALDLGAGPTLKDTQPPPPPTPAATIDAGTTQITPVISSSTSTPVAQTPATASTNTPTTPSGPTSDVTLGLEQMTQAADYIATLPYIWGGGHGSFVSPGYDCSGSVSYVLHAAGLLSAPEDSSELMSYGAPGPGQYITIYATDGHAWMTINGRRFDTVALSEDGSRWADGGGEFDGYVERHPVGF